MRWFIYALFLTSIAVQAQVKFRFSTDIEIQPHLVDIIFSQLNLSKFCENSTQMLKKTETHALIKHRHECLQIKNGQGFLNYCIDNLKRKKTIELKKVLNDSLPENFKILNYFTMEIDITNFFEIKMLDIVEVSDERFLELYSQLSNLMGNSGHATNDDLFNNVSSIKSSGWSPHLHASCTGCKPIAGVLLEMFNLDWAIKASNIHGVNKIFNSNSNFTKDEEHLRTLRDQLMWHENITYKGVTKLFSAEKNYIEIRRQVMSMKSTIDHYKNFVLTANEKPLAYSIENFGNKIANIFPDIDWNDKGYDRLSSYLLNNIWLSLSPQMNSIILNEIPEELIAKQDLLGHRMIAALKRNDITEFHKVLDESESLSIGAKRELINHYRNYLAINTDNSFPRINLSFFDSDERKRTFLYREIAPYEKASDTNSSPAAKTNFTDPNYIRKTIEEIAIRKSIDPLKPIIDETIYLLNQLNTTQADNQVTAIKLMDLLYVQVEIIAKSQHTIFISDFYNYDSLLKIKSFVFNNIEANELGSRSDLRFLFNSSLQIDPGFIDNIFTEGDNFNLLLEKIKKFSLINPTRLMEFIMTSSAMHVHAISFWDKLLNTEWGETYFKIALGNTTNNITTPQYFGFLVKTNSGNYPNLENFFRDNISNKDSTISKFHHERVESLVDFLQGDIFSNNPLKFFRIYFLDQSSSIEDLSQAIRMYNPTFLVTPKMSENYYLGLKKYLSYKACDYDLIPFEI